MATVRAIARDVSDLKDATDKVANEVRTMATARKTLDGRIERLTTEYTALEAKVLVVQSDQQDLKNEYKKIRCSIAELDRSNDVINTEINHLKKVHDFIMPVVDNHSLSTKLKRKRSESVERRPVIEDPPTKRRDVYPIPSGKRR
jgi:chromosome segregation ATPase